MKIDAGEWYDDNESRAMVSREIFLSRIERGWKGQRALMEPLGNRQVPGARGRHLPRDIRSEAIGGRDAKLHEAFGISRTLAEWERVTGVMAHNIRHGIDRHDSLQRFLHHIGWYPGKARYVDDEVELVVDSKPWRPGDTLRKPIRQAPAKKYVKVNLDDDCL